jgi:glycosyltransferase involved in cell wall biosynthesis
LVAPNNPEALADAIELLGRDDTWRRHLAMRHRERVLTEFGDDVILPQYRQLIERMADSVRA